MTTTAINATESAAALALEHGIDLSEVEGSGNDKRILIDDVRKLLPDESPAAAPGKPKSGLFNGKTPAELMTERGHLEGCPAPADRIEAYMARRPAKTDSNGAVIAPAGEILMVHCIECGGTQEVK